MAASKIKMMVWMLAVLVTFADGQQRDDVLIWEVTSLGTGTRKFIFEENFFIEFHHCLCSLATEGCQVLGDANGRITMINRYELDHDQIASNDYSNRYLCHIDYDHYYLSCSRMQYFSFLCSSTLNCWTLSVTEQEESKKCDLKFVQIIWSQDQYVNEAYRNATVVDRKPSCPTGCSINKIVLTSTSTAATPTPMTPISRTSAKLKEIHSDNQRNAAVGSGDKGNVAGVITGAVIGLVVVVGILVVLGVLYWKRKKK